MRNKKIIQLVLSFIVLASIANGQAPIPASKTFKENGKVVIDLNEKVQRSIDYIKSNNPYNPNFNQKKLDSLAYQAELDTLNQSPSIIPILTGGVVNLESIKESYGLLTFGMVYRLSKYKITKKQWFDPHFIYVMFNIRSALSPDSNSIRKSFLFPEINKRDFVVGYFWQFRKNGWSLAPTGEFALNRLSDSSNSKSFVSQSFILGIKIQKAFNQASGAPAPTFFEFFPFYNLINVDPKYFDDYSYLTGETHIPTTFHSLGLNISAQLPNGIFFCNMKYILNKSKEIKSPDLIRFNYTLGTLLAL